MTKAYEIPLELTEEGKLDLPAELAEELLDGDDLKVIILIPNRPDLWEEPEGGRLAHDRFGVGSGVSDPDTLYLRYKPRKAHLDQSRLEEHKAALLKAFDSHFAVSTMQLPYLAMEFLEGVPPDDENYDYGGLIRALNHARDALLEEGMLTRSERGNWNITKLGQQYNDVAKP